MARSFKERFKRKPREARIYILPTGFGLVFLAGSMLMILVGATYQNNLVNLLAFFMLSLIFVSMVQTNLNLRDVKVDSLQVEPNYAGRDLLVTLALANTSREPRFNLEFSLKNLEPRMEYDQVLPLLGKSTIKLKSAYVAGHRGVHLIPRVRVFTDYPLGLFRAWVWVDTNSEYFVFPEPKGAKTASDEGTGVESVGTKTTKGGDDFSGHRRYQLGDSMARIDWKAHARGRRWLLKEFDGGQPTALKFEWKALESLDHESKLSQMAAWIEQAELQKLPYAVHLPGFTTAAGLGTAHANRILKVLAVLEEKENSHAA